MHRVQYTQSPSPLLYCILTSRCNAFYCSEQIICTFIVAFSFAHSMAFSASERGKAYVIYFSTCRGRWLSAANNSKALSIGPHRLPTTLSSSITKGAALNFSPAAHVLLRTYDTILTLDKMQFNYSPLCKVASRVYSPMYPSGDIVPKPMSVQQGCRLLPRQHHTFRHARMQHR